MTSRGTAVSILGAALGFGTFVNKSDASKSSGFTASSINRGLQCTGRLRRGRRGRRGAGTASTEEAVAASSAVVSRFSTPSVLGTAITKGRTGTNLVLALRTAASVGGDYTSGGGCGASGSTSRRWRRGTRGRVAVPVSHRLVHALAHGDTLEATCLKSLDHGDSKIESGKLVDVVSDGKLALSGRVGGVDGIAEVVLSNLNLLAGELVVVIGIQIEVRDDVSELSKDILANSVARRIRRAHICRVFANNVADGHLILDHLVIDLSLSDLGEILVRPGVGSDLVTLCDHASDDSTPLLINGTLAKVNTSDEEGSFETGSSELIQDLVSVDVWTVIVSNGNGSWLATRVDASTAVVDIALLGTGIVTGGSSSRCLVGIAAGTKFEQAVRSIAVVRSVSTISSTGAAEARGTLGVAKAGSTAVVGVTTLSSVKVVRTLSSRGASSTRRGRPDLDVAGQAKELRGSLNATMGSSKGCHGRGSEDFEETHYYVVQFRYE